jgi:hypothetical protein
VWRLTLRLDEGLKSRRMSLRQRTAAHSGDPPKEERNILVLQSVMNGAGGRLWTKGKTDATIVLEQLFNELAKHHGWTFFAYVRYRTSRMISPPSADSVQNAVRFPSSGAARKQAIQIFVLDAAVESHPAR